jgi:ribosomal protein L19
MEKFSLNDLSLHNSYDAELGMMNLSAGPEGFSFIPQRVVEDSNPRWNMHVGDVVNFSYTKNSITYGSEGICLHTRRKNKVGSEFNFLPRNILDGIGVEITVSLLPARVYDYTLPDYKRKSGKYRRAKLYYLRRSLNRASRVK